MKIRNGFVSNSSSSSFVVGFRNIPTSVEEMKSLLDCSECRNPDKVAEIVFNQLNEVPATLEEVAEEFSYRYDIYYFVKKDIYPDRRFVLIDSCFVDKGLTKKLIDLNKELDDLPYELPNVLDNSKNIAKRSKLYNEIRKLEKELSLIDAKHYLGKHPEYKFFIFYISDEDGIDYSQAEHGDIFRNLPNVRISKH